MLDWVMWGLAVLVSVLCLSNIVIALRMIACCADWPDFVALILSIGSLGMCIWLLTMTTEGM